MTTPTRLRDHGPDEVRALLRHARKTRDLAPEDRARTRARVARIGVAAAVAGGLTLLQSAALGAGLAILTLIGAEIGSRALAPAAPPAAATPPSSPSAVAVALALVAPPLVPSASVPRTASSSEAPLAPPPPRSATHRVELAPPIVDIATPAPRPATDTLAEEAALIESARAALARSPTEALQRAEEHASRFPAGKLAMESEFVAIDALTRLGRKSEARTRAESLLARARGGLYEERLRQLVDGLR